MCALPGSKSTNCVCTLSGCERQTSHYQKQSRTNQPIHFLHSSFECLLHVFRLHHGVDNVERLFNILLIVGCYSVWFSEREHY